MQQLSHLNSHDGVLAEELPAAMPEVTDFKYTDSFNSYYTAKVTSEVGNAAYDYLKALDKGATITINGEECAKNTSYFGGTGYQINASAGEIKFSDDKFSKTGNYTVVISGIEGYDDLTFYVADGKLVDKLPEVNPEPSLLEAPFVADVTKEGSSIMSKYYHTSFDGEEADIAAFVEAINNIVIGSEKIKAVNTFFNTDTMSYKTSNDPAFGGADKYVDFTLDCFGEGSGEFTVVISADGYEDLIFSVFDGQLVQD